MINRRVYLAVLYLLIALSLTVIYGVVFQYIMSAYEGQEYSIYTGVYWVITILTTTGLGDISFTTPVGRAFTIIVELTGIILIFGLLFPLIVTPWLESRIRKTLPRRAPEEVEGHILICGYSPLIDVLISELEEEGEAFVVVDERESICEGLLDRGIVTVNGDPGNADVLRAAGIMRARALIANMEEEKNAEIVLTTRDIRDIEIIALVESMDRAKYLSYAGATRVVSPKALLGIYLGKKALDPITDKIVGATEFLDGVRILELPIYPTSDLIGDTLKEARLRTITGANVVGVWSGGELIPNPPPDLVIKENSVLLAIGSSEQLKKLKALTK